jgi:hypothetical protein
VQHWFFTAGLIGKEFPADRLVDTAFADQAAQALGPFTLENGASPLAGCR